MVEISEVEEETTTTTTAENGSGAAAAASPVDLRSQERLADADEIESALLAHITRPSARLHVQNLITKLRKEGKALMRVAASTTDTAVGSDSAAAPSSLPAPPKRTPVTSPVITSSANKYQPFPTHYFECGEYNSPFVTVYIPLSGIGSHDKSKISCNFTPTSFDVVVADYTDGKSYRLLNDNLEKDIDVTKSKYVVKSNKIIIKLGKIKGEYGSYDHWTELTAKKTKKKDGDGKTRKEDPTAGIMDLMKDMYDNGDDNMKKMIGETMYKQRTGQLGRDGGMGGLGDMGDLGL